jgi:hypothetical protein
VTRDETKAGGAPGGADCEKSEGLIAYLYGETGPAESREIRAHLEACAVCREELAAFGGVRTSIALWRAEAESQAPALGASALSGAAAPELEAASHTDATRYAETFAPAVVARENFTPEAGAGRRSARAALREFFSLSPLWLRAASVAAALLVCALAALILVRGEVTWNDEGFAFRIVAPVREATPAAPAPGTEPDTPLYTREQVEEMVAERVGQELAAERARPGVESRRETAAATNPDADAGPDAGTRAGTVAGRLAGGAMSRPPARVLTAASEKAATTRRTPPAGTRRTAVAVAGEDDLPRLSDLLGVSYD